MELGLSGRVALVTGAAVGIGLAIVETLAAEGCRAWIADRDLEAAERSASGLRADGRDVRAVSMDVTRPAEVAAAVDRVHGESGRLDVLVCNAGILKTGPFTDMSAADWDAVAAVNLTGLIACIRQAVPFMMEAGSGRIVNIASISAMRGGGSLGNVLYGTSKAGVVALTLGLARELGPSGITVNAVAPALADTPMTHASLTPDTIARVTSRIPLRRLATPSDIANAVVFLASNRAGFISGAVLPLDGGLLTT